MTPKPAEPALPPNAKQVRADDAFDVEAVDRWLKSELGALTGEPGVRQFVGGASNLTYLLSYPDRELILRRPPAGTKASSAHDMAREYRVQKQLAPQFPLVPEVVALCTDHDVLGADFYVMERIPGTILRSDLPAGAALDPDQAGTLCRAVVDVLAQLHAVDPEAAGLSGLGKGPGYVQRQVTGWSGRYRKARTWNVPKAEGVMAWLAERMPEDAGYCVIHNDFRLDNIVLAPGDLLKPVGVLDWELATLGDPLMDLGCSLAYWVQADDDPVMRKLRRQPTHLPGMFTRAQLLETYAERTGLTARDFTFYEVYGLFRLAVIIQQIYYRYHHKQSTNPAFRNYWLMAGYLIWRCNRLIAKAPLMPTAILVRHGQASFGSSNYDVLSPVGHQQAELVGTALADRVAPAALVTGSLARQRDTASSLIKSAGFDLVPRVDVRWDEYDHTMMLKVHAGRLGAFRTGVQAAFGSGRAVQLALDTALHHWITSGSDASAGLTWRQFQDGAVAALDEALSGPSPAVVVTSGGVISAVCAHLLGLDAGGFVKLNRVGVNTGITTVVSGRSGTSLLSFNEHAHLAGADRKALLTYR